MRTIIAGSRTATPQDVRAALAACPWTSQITFVISGTAAGADQEGERWAAEHHIPVQQHPANWQAFGKRAGPLRNKEMAGAADSLIAVWDGASRGTKGMIDLARERQLTIYVHTITPQGTTTKTPLPPPPAHPTTPREPDRIRTVPRNKAYRMNALVASLPRDTTLALTREPYDDKRLSELRASIGTTHAVLRDRSDILCIPYEPDTLAAHENIRLSDHPHIVQHLLRDWVFRNLARHHPRRLKGGSVRYVSDRPSANLLTTVLPTNTTIPPSVGQRIATDFHVRRIHSTKGPPLFAILIDVNTSITIDCTVAELLALGVNVIGLYVLRVHETSTGPTRRLAGRVRAIDGTSLLLEDHEPHTSTLSTATAWLEPRREHLERIIRAITGSAADRTMNALHASASQRLHGLARIKMIDDWVASLRRHPAILAQRIPITLDASVLHANDPRFPPHETLEKPVLVFDPARNKTDRWNQRGIDEHGPYNFERFPQRRLNIAIICQATRQGHVERVVHQLINGLPGGNHARSGLMRRYRLDAPFTRTFTSRSPAAIDYRSAVAAAIDDATTRQQPWHLALIQTDEGFHDLTGDHNPYLVTKALLLAHQVPTQAFEWETIRPGMPLDAVLSVMGLATYAKVNGTPWLLPAHQSTAHELIVGIGSYEARDSRLGPGERYIGVATVFTSEGRYILESRTPATPASDYLNELLATLKRVIDTVRKGDAWTDDQPVRLIFHVFKDFNHAEISAVKQLMHDLHLPHATFAFVHLVEDHPYLVTDPSQHGPKGAGVPPRGLTLELGQRETLVHLRGPRELRRDTDGPPRAILLRLHPDSSFTSLSYLARQVFDFSCLSWRGFQASPLPISVYYADLVAQQLLGLRDVTSWTPEAILGPIGRTRWFL